MTAAAPKKSPTPRDRAVSYLRQIFKQSNTTYSESLDNAKIQAAEILLKVPEEDLRDEALKFLLSMVEGKHEGSVSHVIRVRAAKALVEAEAVKS